MQRVKCRYLTCDKQNNKHTIDNNISLQSQKAVSAHL